MQVHELAYEGQLADQSAKFISNGSHNTLAQSGALRTHWLESIDIDGRDSHDQHLMSRVTSIMAL
jgi:hypothetical protein